MLLIVPCTNASAQSQHVYEDSAALYPEQSGSYDEKVEVVEAPAEITDSNTPVRAEEVDTDLVNNRHFLSPDSLIALQNEKQLLYAKDLDSLLRKFQKQQQAKADKAARKSEDGSNIPIGVTVLESFLIPLQHNISCGA